MLPRAIKIKIIIIRNAVAFQNTMVTE